MKSNTIIQRVVSTLIFFIGLVFGILGLFGVTVTVNQSDVNSIIFGFGALIAAAIELIPIIVQMLKDKETRQLLDIVNDVVWAVEELKGLSSEEKKRKAMMSVSAICTERGIKFDSIKVDRMIESVINVYNTVVKNGIIKKIK